MDPNLKQRLVGATVLCALAVIFVPMLFDNSGGDSGTREFEIPEISAQLEQEPPQPAKQPRDSAPADSTAEPNTEQSSPKTPDTEKHPSPGAWIIQVGTFSKRENADQLLKRLRHAKYPAYVESGTSKGAAIYRVRVGPELDRERAVNQRDHIAREFNVKGIVLPVP